jgi:hypothetical protein
MTDEQPTASSGRERRLRKRTQALIVVVIAPLLALAGLGATYLQRLPEPESDAAAEEPTLEEDLLRIPDVEHVIDETASSASVSLALSDSASAPDAAVQALELIESHDSIVRTLAVSIPGDDRVDHGGSLAWNVGDDSVDPSRIAADVELWTDLAAVDRLSYVYLEPVPGEVRSVSGTPAYRDDRTIATAAEIRAAWEAILAENSIEAILRVDGS